MPNVLDIFGMPWVTAAGRLIWAVVVTAILLAPVMVVVRRPRQDRPTTWAAAMAGAVYVFALFLLTYAVIPHEFITFADKYLQMGSDKYVLGIKSSRSMIGGLNWPFTFDYKALRDIIVVGIYLVFFGLNLALFVQWQKRPTETESERAERVAVGRSRFGRPLKAKA